MYICTRISTYTFKFQDKLYYTCTSVAFIYGFRVWSIRKMDSKVYCIDAVAAAIVEPSGKQQEQGKKREVESNGEKSPFSSLFLSSLLFFFQRILAQGSYGDECNLRQSKSRRCGSPRGGHVRRISDSIPFEISRFELTVKCFALVMPRLLLLQEQQNKVSLIDA